MLANQRASSWRQFENPVSERCKSADTDGFSFYKGLCIKIFDFERIHGEFPREFMVIRKFR